MQILLQADEDQRSSRAGPGDGFEKAQQDCFADDNTEQRPALM